MKTQAYFQGTENPNKKRKPDELPTKREDLDVRHPHIYTVYKNFDYTDDPNPNATGIGGGLYHGPMDRFKSVKEFLDKRRKKMKERREKAEKQAKRLDLLLKLAGTIWAKDI